MAPKEFEVRLTVVGQTFLAARIDAHSARARIDWRTDLPALDYRVIDTPPAALPDRRRRRDRLAGRGTV
ncbi:MAG: hypothetical protein ACRDQ5_18970 [Sciscionella sp.]